MEYFIIRFTLDILIGAPLFEVEILINAYIVID